MAEGSVIAAVLSAEVMVVQDPAVLTPEPLPPEA
jgi:hypothetical protein